MKLTKKKLRFIIFIFLLLIAVTFNYFRKDEIVNEEPDTAFVVRVIDGDTFEIESGEHVRLICINTPEKNEPYYQEAKNYLTNRTLNKQVILERDKTNTDQFGRLLRYVKIVNESQYVNYDVVKNGFGKVKIFKPNIKYCDLFEEGQSEAVEKKLGVWNYNY